MCRSSPSARVVASAPDLCAFLSDEGISAKRLHISKILHSLVRKGMLSPLTKETDPPGPAEFKSECSAYGCSSSGYTRYHFRGSDNVYCGYCDRRPDGTVAESFLTERCVTTEGDTYCFLPCKYETSVHSPQGDRQVTGFPSVEKDGGIVMCAQAALCSVARYWHARSGGQMFSNLYAPEISRAAGVPEEDIRPSARRGLSHQEIACYLSDEQVASQSFPFLHLPANLVKDEHPERVVYSFVESRMPVMGIIKTVRGYHAVVFIGHTFDKNAWDAAADVGYFAQLGSGLGGQYHSNISWIRHFVVHDDNFGPYSFFPVDKLADVLATLWVVLPSAEIQVNDALAPVETGRRRKTEPVQRALQTHR